MNRRFHVVVLLCLLVVMTAGQPRLIAAVSRPQQLAPSAGLSNRVYLPAVNTAAPAPPSAPALLAEVNGPGKGRVWIGATPFTSEAKPVLVFVHGLHGSAQSWWGPTGYSGGNDMYELAYAHGYRTAFVSLDDEVGGPASSMWVNGATLNRQLDVILKHFAVTSVSIIAHSKGGVDANSAIAHAGASAKVQNIVTLSSPHHGSQLVDLAYSEWAGWLTALLGQRDDGTYVLQTSYMRYFRSLADDRPENEDVRFWTAGGTDHGPLFSSLWYAGSYLSSYGPNDGLVTVASSNHPRQSARLFTAHLNHDNIRKGSAVWASVEPAVSSSWRTAVPATRHEPSATTFAASNVEASRMILRGGQLREPSQELHLPVEGGVRQIYFDLLSNSSALQVAFVDPQGLRYQVAAPVPDQGIFRGAFHYMATRPAPLPGEWTVEVRGDQGAAYLLVATVDSSLEVTVTRSGVVLPDGQVDVGVSVAALGKQAPEVAVAARLTGTLLGQESPGNLSTQRENSSRGRGGVATQLEAPSASGLYQLGVTVTGVGPDGSAFERSFPDNLVVLAPQHAQSATLPPGR